MAKSHKSSGPQSLYCSSTRTELLLVCIRVFLFCTLSASIFTAHPQAWADFLKAEKLTEDLLLKSYQIIHRVSAAPTFRKGLYCGGAEAGLIQGLDLLENYITSRLSSVQFATSVVKVTCHNHTPYDLTAYFADTSLPCLLVPLPQRLAPIDLGPFSLPPPARPLRLKLKVQNALASVEFHGNTYPLRRAFASCI